MVGQNLGRWQPKRSHGAAQGAGQFAANTFRTRVASRLRQTLGLEARARPQFRAGHPSGRLLTPRAFRAEVRPSLNQQRAPWTQTAFEWIENQPDAFKSSRAQ